MRVKDILAEECEASGISVERALSHSREQELLWLRYRVFWRARRETTASYPQIGRVMKRDHTTVINGERRYQAVLDGQVYRRAGRSYSTYNSAARNHIGG